MPKKGDPVYNLHHLMGKAQRFVHTWAFFAHLVYNASLAILDSRREDLEDVGDTDLRLALASLPSVNVPEVCCLAGCPC